MRALSVGTQYRPIYESHQISGAFSRAPDEHVVPDWLNAAAGTASCNRVARVIENIRKTDELTKAAMAAGAYHHVSSGANRNVIWDGTRYVFRKPTEVSTPRKVVPIKWPATKVRPQRAADAPLAELARALGRYQFSLKATRTISLQSGQWLPNLSCRIQRDDFGIQIAEGKYTSRKQRSRKQRVPLQDSRAFEGDVVFAVLRLAGCGHLDRLKRCPKCSKWLFAAHTNYKFCSRECALSVYTDNPEYRQKKKNQMREYRKRDKRETSRWR